MISDGPEKQPNARTKQRVGARWSFCLSFGLFSFLYRYSLYKYGGQQEKEQKIEDKKNTFGAHNSAPKYDKLERGGNKTFQRLNAVNSISARQSLNTLNSINTRQSLDKNREKLAKHKETKDIVANFKIEDNEISKEESSGTFNISIGGKKGRQDYKVSTGKSSNRSRQRRRKLQPGAALNPEKEEVEVVKDVQAGSLRQDVVRLEREEMKRVGELVRRRLSEELRRIFKEQLVGKTREEVEVKKNALKVEEKQKKQSARRRIGENENEVELNSLETDPPLPNVGRSLTPQLIIRKRLALPFKSEIRRVDKQERHGEGLQEAAFSLADDNEDGVKDKEEKEKQKYFRKLWSARQARVSARLRKGRNGAHQNVSKKHQRHHRRFQQRKNGPKKANYDTAGSRILQNNLVPTESR